MPTDAFKGLAQFAGCAMVFDVIVSASAAIQDATLTQNYDVEKVKSSLGATCSKRAVDEIHDLEINMKCVGTTAAAARALNTISAGGFLPMFQSVVITQPSTGPQMPAGFIGTWSMKPGAKVSAKAVACGDMSLSLEKYADATQNTLMTTTPS